MEQRLMGINASPGEVKGRIRATREKNRLRSLVNTNGTKVKVSFGECTRVVINEVKARAGAPIPIEGGSRPTTTQRQVDYDVAFREHSFNIALRVTREQRSWGTLQSKRGDENLALENDIFLVIDSPNCRC